MDEKLRKKYEVPLANLKYTCDSEEFASKPKKKPSNDLEHIVIGQEKAVKSIRYGLEMHGEHHNIFLTGPTGTRKNMLLNGVIKDYIQTLSPEQYKEKMTEKEDLVAVYNFKNPNKPLILALPTIRGISQGERFKKTMKIATTFMLDQGAQNLGKINEVYEQKKRSFLEDNDSAGRQMFKMENSYSQTQKRLGIIQTELNELEQNTNLSDESKKQRAEIQKEKNELIQKIKKLDSEMDKIERFISQNLTKIEHEHLNNQNQLQTSYAEGIKEIINGIRRAYAPPDKIEELTKNITGVRMSEGKSLKCLKKEYKRLTKIQTYLNMVEKEMIKDSQKLLTKKQEEKDLGDNMIMPQSGQNAIMLMGMPQQQNKEPKKEEDELLKYKINLLTPRSTENIREIPVIFADTPNLENLFGLVEPSEKILTLHGGASIMKKDQHLRLKPGLMIKANGGYLTINMMDLLAYSGEIGLKRLIKDIEKGRTTIGLKNETFSFYFMENIENEEIDLNLKVILTGPEGIYQRLLEISQDGIHEEFTKTFNVKAQLDHVTANTEQNRKKYFQYLTQLCEEEGLKDITSEGTAKIIEYSTRLANKQNKLTTNLDVIENLVREASQEAKDSEFITPDHVQKAIKAKEKRHSLIEEKYQEFIDKEIVSINVSGEKVGELNGLAVLGLEDAQFGIASRITSNLSRGKGGIIDVHTKVDLSGPIKQMGELIYDAIVEDRYLNPLNEHDIGESVSFRCQLVHEQTYSMIDGDSASSTGLYVALSKIGQFPLDQGISVTGRVSQRGEIQAIGGVNEKIEAFYQTCKEKGFTSKQGVMIPKINEKDLALNDEILESIEKGEFHIYSVSKFEEGLEVLTGSEMKDIDKKVAENLIKFSDSKKNKKFRRFVIP